MIIKIFRVSPETNDKINKTFNTLNKTHFIMSLMFEKDEKNRLYLLIKAIEKNK